MCVTGRSLFICFKVVWTILSAMDAVFGWRASTALLVYGAFAYFLWCYSEHQNEVQRISADLGEVIGVVLQSVVLSFRSHTPGS